MYKKAYLSILSRAFGRFANHSFTPLLQHAINLAFIKYAGIKRSTIDNPAAYPTLNALFTRELKDPPKLPKAKGKILSCAQALVSESGRVVQGRLFQIKGMEYELEPLLGEELAYLAKELEGAEYINFYLSPKDYHRYHSPCDLKVEAITHIPGRLLPVNFPFLKRKKDLFVENERVVVSAVDKNQRRHILVLVGALNVGKMRLDFEPSLQTNVKNAEVTHIRYKRAKSLKRGEEFGRFEMGSTILYIVQRGAMVSEVCIGEKLNVLQSIGRLKPK